MNCLFTFFCGFLFVSTPLTALFVGLLIQCGSQTKPVCYTVSVAKKHHASPKLSGAKLSQFLVYGNKIG